jgi:hypothetical protein
LIFLFFLWFRRSFVTLLAVFFCPDEVDFHPGSQAGRETAGLKCPKNWNFRSDKQLWNIEIEIHFFRKFVTTVKSF